MNAETALGELEALAEKLQVQVNYDHFTTEGNVSGGLCKLRGQWRVIIERKTSVTEKVSTLARCLSGFDLEDTYLSPALRDLLNQHRP